MLATSDASCCFADVSDVRYDASDGTYSLVLVLAEARLQLFLLAGKIRLLMPNIVLSRLIDLGKFMLRRANPIGSLLGSVPGNITGNDYRVINLNIC